MSCCRRRSFHWSLLLSDLGPTILVANHRLFGVIRRIHMLKKATALLFAVVVAFPLATAVSAKCRETGSLWRAILRRSIRINRL